MSIKNEIDMPIKTLLPLIVFLVSLSFASADAKAVYTDAETDFTTETGANTATPKTVPRARSTPHFKKQPYSAKVPIDVINNRIFVIINISPTERKRLLVDSGASVSLLLDPYSEVTDSLPSQPVSFPALNLRTTAYNMGAQTFTLGGADVTVDRLLLITDRLRHLIEKDTAFEGILGQDLFEQYIVEINPQKLEMTLWPRGTSMTTKFKNHSKLSIIDNRPILTTRVSLPWENLVKKRDFLLDTGFAGALVLWQDRKFRRKLNRIAGMFDKSTNYAVIMDYGFAGYKLHRAPVFMMKETEQLPTEFDGLVGMAFLNMFHYAIDFPRGYLHLTPQSKLTVDHPKLLAMLQFAPNSEPFSVIHPQTWSEGCKIAACMIIK